jgi:hypothetical protein
VLLFLKFDHSTVTTIDTTAYLNEHNRVRTLEGASNMQAMVDCPVIHTHTHVLTAQVWDTGLQRMAENWAVQCKSPSTDAHRPLADRSSPAIATYTLSFVCILDYT